MLGVGQRVSVNLTVPLRIKEGGDYLAFLLGYSYMWN